MEPRYKDNWLTLYVCDVLNGLRELPDCSVHCCVTSPPYWGLRDYSVAGQIGLERTPEEYVAKMVEVFREVKRVLRNDGTLWLNLGDSYWGGKGQSNYAFQERRESETLQQDHHNITGIGETRPQDGQHPVIKPKDLVGIPWMVAFALRQPYYTGRIKRVEDRIWLAAMLEAEGCLFIHKRKAGQNAGSGYTRQSDTYSPGLEIANTHEGIIRRCIEIAGVGSICSQSPEQNGRRKQTIFRWNLRTTESRDLVRELYPYIVAKRQQARILCGCPTSGREADAAHAALKLLHNGSQTTVDFKEPQSMFEPGWYLRSDVIWSKPNPMPESVTDRPTKAHEYIFLLSKSARYFYDAEAVKEASIDPESLRPEGRNPRGKDKYAKAFLDENECGYARTRAGFDKLEGVRYPLRNKRTVWTVPSQPYPESHFATYPEDLIKPCILAGTSARGCCPKCGAPWGRVVESSPMEIDRSKRTHELGRTRSSGTMTKPPETKTIGWQPTCSCDDPINPNPFNPIPCTVLDPFGGSGTTGKVALERGRKAILIELNPDSGVLIMSRTHVTPALNLA